MSHPRSIEPYHVTREGDQLVTVPEQNAAGRDNQVTTLTASLVISSVVVVEMVAGMAVATEAAISQRILVRQSIMIGSV